VDTVCTGHVAAHCPKLCSEECIQALTDTVAGEGDDRVMPEIEDTVTAMQARIDDTNRRLEKTVDEADRAASNENINEEISESVDAMESKLNGQLGSLWTRVFG